MLKDQKKLLNSLKMGDPQKLLHIPPPITTEMTQSRPSLSREFESHFSIRHTLLMSLRSFIVSMLFHFVIWLCYRYKHRHPNTPLCCGSFCPKKPRRAVS